MSESAQIVLIAVVSTILGSALLVSICLGVALRLRAGPISVEAGKAAEKK